MNIYESKRPAPSAQRSTCEISENFPHSHTQTPGKSLFKFTLEILRQFSFNYELLKPSKSLTLPAAQVIKSERRGKQGVELRVRVSCPGPTQSMNNCSSGVIKNVSFSCGTYPESLWLCGWEVRRTRDNRRGLVREAAAMRKVEKSIYLNQIAGFIVIVGRGQGFYKA